MFFNLLITQTLPNAEAVLGQSSWSANTSGTSLDRFQSPSSCYYDGTKFYVNNHTTDRIQVWNSYPTMASVTDMPAANFILGTGTAGSAVNELRDPFKIHKDGSNLFIVQRAGARVSVYSTALAGTDSPNADFFLEQSTGSRASRLGNMDSMTSNGTGRLYITDNSRNRISVFASLDGTSYPDAVAVIGQADFDGEGYFPVGVDIHLSHDISDLAYSNGRLIIADTVHRRVLIIPAK